MAQDLNVDNLAESILDLVRRTEKLLCRQASDPRQRMVVAFAGVPGSGKSTVSDALLAELDVRGVHDVAVVPMDGFHLTRKALSEFEDPHLAFRRRGAPFTFDAEGCVKFVKVLKSTPVTTATEPELLMRAPSFDHAVKDPVQDAISISSRNRLVIVEGNYTLLNQSPWNEIAEYSEERWFVNAPADVVKERLVQRHLAAGIETSALAATQRSEENDVPNGDLIRSLLIKPDVYIEN